MTKLSVNINKIALLRNSRGRDYPNVCEYARKFIELGVHGITLHPRPDKRHATQQDAHDLAQLVQQYSAVELNIEGYPSEAFLTMIEAIKPDQCTLVPDDANQLTSDHGWQVTRSENYLQDCLTRLQSAGVRSSLFIDPDPVQITAAADLNCDRIELYTEQYADAYRQQNSDAVLQIYTESARLAQSLGLGVNAGHDFNLQNLGSFLQIDNILEVSIGHALVVECLDQGVATVIKQYLQLCKCSNV